MIKKPSKFIEQTNQTTFSDWEKVSAAQIKMIDYQHPEEDQWKCRNLNYGSISKEWRDKNNFLRKGLYFHSGFISYYDIDGWSYDNQFGPARIFEDGRIEYWIKGQQLLDVKTQEQFDRWKRLKAFW